MDDSKKKKRKNRKSKAPKSTDYKNNKRPLSHTGIKRLYTRWVASYSSEGPKGAKRLGFGAIDAIMTSLLGFLTTIIKGARVRARNAGKKFITDEDVDNIVFKIK